MLCSVLGGKRGGVYSEDAAGPLEGETPQLVGPMLVICFKKCMVDTGDFQRYVGSTERAPNAGLTLNYADYAA